jgi:hypothetical protein
LRPKHFVVNKIRGEQRYFFTTDWQSGQTRTSHSRGKTLRNNGKMRDLRENSADQQMKQ